jgi:hypothetical protein
MEQAPKLFQPDLHEIAEEYACKVSATPDREKFRYFESHQARMERAMRPGTWRRA